MSGYATSYASSVFSNPIDDDSWISNDDSAIINELQSYIETDIDNYLNYGRSLPRSSHVVSGDKKVRRSRSFEAKSSQRLRPICETNFNSRQPSIVSKLSYQDDMNRLNSSTPTKIVLSNYGLSLPRRKPKRSISLRSFRTRSEYPTLTKNDLLRNWVSRTQGVGSSYPYSKSAIQERRDVPPLGALSPFDNMTGDYDVSIPSSMLHCDVIDVG